MSILQKRRRGVVEDTGVSQRAVGRCETATRTLNWPWSSFGERNH